MCGRQSVATSYLHIAAWLNFKDGNGKNLSPFLPTALTAVDSVSLCGRSSLSMAY